jgi:hypothetical protein
MMDAVCHLDTAPTGRHACERELGAVGIATVSWALDLEHDRKIAAKVNRLSVLDPWLR